MNQKTIKTFLRLSAFFIFINIGFELTKFFITHKSQVEEIKISLSRQTGDMEMLLEMGHAKMFEKGFQIFESGADLEQAKKNIPTRFTEKDLGLQPNNTCIISVALSPNEEVWCRPKIINGLIHSPYKIIAQRRNGQWSFEKTISPF